MASELLEERGECRLPIRRAFGVASTPHLRERAAQALLVERLEQVIDRAHFERLERELIVGRDEHDEGQGPGIERARELEATH